MYNRYIPQEDCNWVPAGREHSPARQGGIRLPPFLAGQEGISALFPRGKGQGVVSGTLKALGLEELDTGDVLLLLIVLYLLAEGDDLDLVIALGLVLIMGLGEEKER